MAKGKNLSLETVLFDALSMEELLTHIHKINPDQFITQLHKRMSHSVTSLNSKLDDHGLSAVVEWPNKGRIAILFKTSDPFLSNNINISHKHIHQLHKAMEKNKCTRGILYTTSVGIPAALYKVAVEYGIEVVDLEDLFRLSAQVDAGITK